MKKSFKDIKRVQQTSEKFNNKILRVSADLNIKKDINGIEDINDYWMAGDSIIGHNTIDSLDKTKKNSSIDNLETIVNSDISDISDMFINHQKKSTKINDENLNAEKDFNGENLNVEKDFNGENLNVEKDFNGESLSDEKDLNGEKCRKNLIPDYKNISYIANEKISTNLKNNFVETPLDSKIKNDFLFKNAKKDSVDKEVERILNDKPVNNDNLYDLYNENDFSVNSGNGLLDNDLPTNPVDYNYDDITEESLELKKNTEETRKYYSQGEDIHIDYTSNTTPYENINNGMTSESNSKNNNNNKAIDKQLKTPPVINNKQMIKYTKNKKIYKKSPKEVSNKDNKVINSQKKVIKNKQTGPVNIKVFYSEKDKINGLIENNDLGLCLVNLRHLGSIQEDSVDNACIFFIKKGKFKIKTHGTKSYLITSGNCISFDIGDNYLIKCISLDGGELLMNYSRN